VAWYAGNDPYHCLVKDGPRMVCEILYAINEREVCVGKTPTAWTAIGSYPSATALKGYELAQCRSYIEAARTAISGRLIEREPFGALGGGYYACNESWDRYTFADLYDDAMVGSATTWDTANLQGHCVYDRKVLQELMRCLDKLTRWELESPGKVNSTAYFNQRGAISDDDNATTDAAHTNLMGKTIVLNTSPQRNTTFMQFDYDPYGNDYDDYDGVFVTWHLDEGGPASPDSITLRVVFDVTDGGWPNLINTTLGFYKAAAAEISSPTWTPAGASLGTYSCTQTESGAVKEFDVTSWFHFSPHANDQDGIRLDVGCNSNPFDAAPQQDESTYIPGFYSGGDSGIFLRYVNTNWTYG